MPSIRQFAAFLAFTLLAFFTSPLCAENATTLPKPDRVVDEFFNSGVIPDIHIVLTEAQIKSLADKPRDYVDGVIKEGATTTYDNVKIKLKGSIGSFRDITDRPAITVKMTKKGDQFHGMDRFHLNNSVQDRVFLNELLSNQLALEAGLPAARTTHARVWINDRDLGLYVFKEAFDEKFLSRFFADGKGNLYQAQQGQDIDAALERNEGKGPEDRKDLAALVAACREPDREKRYKLIEENLDVDEFIKFTAMEMMIGHWDGYTGNLNNYRVYFRPDDHRAVFIVHGMDQTFRDKQDRTGPLFEFNRHIVSKAVFENPVWFEKYGARVKELMPLFDPDKLKTKLTAGHDRVVAALAKISKGEVTEYEERYKEYEEIVLTRQKVLLSQFPPERKAAVAAPSTAPASK